MQSGCDATLQRMNRRYTTEEFELIVKRLRNAYSDVILTTDIIVGFPGETDEEFEKTYEFLKRIKFYKMHIFKYSIRSGTKAANMENQIINSIKEMRSKRLLQLSEENQKAYHQEMVGKKVQILVEEKEGEFYKGHTANFMLVKVKSDFKITNQIVETQVEKAEEEELIGENVTN